MTGNADSFRGVSDTIGRKLRLLRAETGLNQAQFAAAIGLTQAGVSKIEGGSRMPSRATIDAWLAACGKTMEIAGLPDLSDGERMILAAVAPVSPDDLFLVAEALRGLAVVEGADRAMARQLLQWLADRAPPQVASDPRPPPSGSIAPESPSGVRE